MGNTAGTTTCPHCGMIHTTKCPLIKAIEYFPDGTVKRVEFEPIAGGNGRSFTCDEIKVIEGNDEGLHVALRGNLVIRDEAQNVILFRRCA